MEDETLNNHPQLSLIETFIEITNCQSKSESLFFLESHNFDLDAAVSTFLDTNEQNNQQQQLSDDDEHQVSPPTLRERSPSPQRGTSQNYNLRSGGRTRGGGGRGTGRRSGITTFADLNKEGEDGEEDSDDEDFDPQEYYTGGEKSGIAVQDPTRRNPTRGNNVDEIFDQARQSGAVGEPEEMPSSSRNFTGTGRLLSGEVSSTPQPAAAVNLTREIVFWRNGFTVDDGPLRSLDDPANAPFLKSVARGELPVELAPANKHAPVHVNLRKKEEDYQEADRPRLPFQGSGKTLGSTSDVTTTVPTDTTTTVVPIDATTAVPTPSQGLVVDESQPSTTIQLRLADGTRLVSRFNNYHTIRDIRGFIDVSRGGATRSYQLQAMGFPPKQLVDLDQTIDQAGIANSVVIQKF